MENDSDALMKSRKVDMNFIIKHESKFGKAKASLQFWAVGFVMIDFQFNILSFNIADLVVLHALIFSYISGYQYISGYIQKTK